MKWSVSKLLHRKQGHHSLHRHKKHEYESEELPPSQQSTSAGFTAAEGTNVPATATSADAPPAASQGDTTARPKTPAVIPDGKAGWGDQDVDSAYKGTRICSLAEDNNQPTVSGRRQNPSAEPGTPEWRKGLRPQLTSHDVSHLHLPLIAKTAAAMGALSSVALLVKLRGRFSLEATLWGTLIGIALGLVLYALIVRNRRRKRQMDRWFNVIMERKDVIQLLGSKPSWMAFKRDQQVQWLNKMMTVLWPSLDKAVGQSIRETVEPLMEQYKPIIIKNINFKHLTFGEYPVFFEDAIVDKAIKDRVCISAPFRLNGDGNIGIALEVTALNVTGSATRMVVKIKDLQVRGTMRIELANLTSELPGFGAVVCSLEYPPLVRFVVDMGSALGGDLSGKLVAAWLDGFLRDTLAAQFVSPNRYVYPMLPESPQNDLKKWDLSHHGVLHVRVIEAKDLQEQDMSGKGDPLVRCWLQPHIIESTKHKKSTTEPHWDETMFFLAQDPHSQFMRLEMFDWDGINLSMMMQSPNLLNNVKESLGAREFMARAVVPLRPTSDKPCRSHDAWYDLGRNDWSDTDGPGTGHGSIHLELRYFPFDVIYSKSRSATHGAVLVRLLEAHDMPAADEDGMSDLFIKLKMAHIHEKSSIKAHTLEATWNEDFQFSNVPINKLLTVEAYDNDVLGRDEKLGMVEIDIQNEVAAAHNCTLERVWYLQEVPKDDKSGEHKRANVSLRVQWVPFDFDSDE